MPRAPCLCCTGCRLCNCVYVSVASTVVKHINITTPKGYEYIDLSDYCIKPTTDSSIVFQAMASENFWVNLITDNGTTGLGYQIGIGAGDKLLGSSEYRPFWISWRDGKIEVGYGLTVRNTSSRFIVWDDQEPLNITGLLLSSNLEGSCIVHYHTGNTTQYTKTPQTRGATVLLSNIVRLDVIECAFRCHIDSECINFNYKV
ncbi:Hypothetical predicted protein [Mytilus galloprovincialis]|uniref:Farnesoic acid O-methyl transferase domain-containing protein n=1 Tax=Mytilus galloprovincialis TaxID=29158 RepID=A0A8B6EL58_MYTGA|nr:Hypothetical predicted protein [Mytilus galloprovincialis]